MIRAHVPPFDTVSPTYSKPEKKVDPARKTDEAELTYQDASKRKQQNDNHNTIAHHRVTTPQTVPTAKTSADKSYLQEVLLAILQNPSTDINNLSANITAARWYAEQVSKSIDNS